MSEKKKSDLPDLFNMVNVFKAGLLDMGMTEALGIFSTNFIGHPESWDERILGIVQRGLKALQG